MKNILYLSSIVLLSAVMFSGCNKARELLNIRFDVSYEKNVDISIPDSSRSLSFQTEVEIDPLSDSTLAKYADKIKDIEILEYYAEVIDIPQELTLNSMYVDVFNGLRSTNWAFHNIVLTPGTRLDMENDNGQWEVLSDILMDKQVFTKEFSGEMGRAVIRFKMKVKMKARITVNPL